MIQQAVLADIQEKNKIYYNLLYLLSLPIVLLFIFSQECFIPPQKKMNMVQTPVCQFACVSSSHL